MVGFCLSTLRRRRARDKVAFLEQKVLDFIPPTMWPTISPDLNQLTIYSICSVLQEKVYPSRIANVDELKTRLFDEWEHFHQLIVDDAITKWRRCLSTCVCVSGTHFEHQFQQVYKFSYFVIYPPKYINSAILSSTYQRLLS